MKHVVPFSHVKLLKRESVFNGMVAKGLRAAVHTLNVDIVTAAAAAFQPDVPPGSPPPAPFTPQALAAVTAAWNAQVSGELFPFLVDTFTESAQSTLELTNAALGLSLDPLSDAWAANYLAFARNRLVGIGDAVWRQMSTTLEHGYAEGMSVVQMAHALQQTAQLSLPRALTIARTEVISAANAGGFQQLITAGFSSDECRKEWLATDDARTREAHHKANGQMVGLLESFTVDGEGLLFPGDPSGSAGNVINCRCSMAFAFTDDAAPASLNDNDLVTAAAESWYEPTYLDMILTMSNEQLNASSWGPAQEKMHPRDNDGKFTEHPGAKILHTLESLTSGGGVKAWTKVIYTTKYDDGAVVAVKPIGPDGSHSQLSWDESKKKFKLVQLNANGTVMHGATPEFYGKGDAYKILKDKTGWHVAPKATPSAKAAATSEKADVTIAKIDEAFGKPKTPGPTTKPPPPSSPGMSTPSASNPFAPGEKMTKAWLDEPHANDDIIGHAQANGSVTLESRAIFKKTPGMQGYVQLQFKADDGSWKKFDSLSLDAFAKYHLGTSSAQDWIITQPNGSTGPLPPPPLLPSPLLPPLPLPPSAFAPGEKFTKAWLNQPHNNGDVIGHAPANGIAMEKRAVFKQIWGTNGYVQLQYKTNGGNWEHFDSLTLDDFAEYHLGASKLASTQDWVITKPDGTVGESFVTVSVPTAPAPKVPAAPAKLAVPAVKGSGKTMHINTKVIYTTKYTHGTVVAVHPGDQTRLIWSDSTKSFELQAHDGDKWKTKAYFGKGAAYKKFKDETGWQSPAPGEGLSNPAGTHAGDSAHAPKVSGNPTAPTITSPTPAAVKTPKTAAVPSTVSGQLLAAFGDVDGFTPTEREHILNGSLGIDGGGAVANLTHSWVSDQQAFYVLANRLTALHQSGYPNMTFIQLTKLYDAKYPPKPGAKSQFDRIKDYLSTPVGKSQAKDYASKSTHFNPFATGLPPTPEQLAAIEAAKKAAEAKVKKAAEAAKKAAEEKTKKFAKMKANFPVAEDISTPEVRPADAEFKTVTYPTAAKWFHDAEQAGHWTPEQKNAIQIYTGSGYHSMNGALRGESVGTDSTWEHIINLQSTMVPVPKDVLVFRGSSHDVLSKALGTSTFADTQKHIGAIIQDEGFMSTSISSSTAFGGSVRYEIQVPKGSAALFVSPHSAVGTSERELLLAAGTKFQIIDVKKKGVGGVTVDTVVMRVVKS